MELLLTGKHIAAEEARASASSGASCPTARRSPRRSGRRGDRRQRPARGAGDQALGAGDRGLPEKEALAQELEIGWPILQTEDAKEGPRAFAEKRKPEFKGQ
jgi:enoyl-CoA hydratase